MLLHSHVGPPDTPVPGTHGRLRKSCECFLGGGLGQWIGGPREPREGPEGNGLLYRRGGNPEDSLSVHYH